MSEIFDIKKLADHKAAKLLEPYYLDLCNQTREMIAARFRAVRREATDGELAAMSIRISANVLKQAAVVRMMEELIKHDSPVEIPAEVLIHLED